MECIARKHYDMIRENFSYRMFSAQKHMLCTEQDTEPRRKNISDNTSAHTHRAHRVAQTHSCKCNAKETQNVYAVAQVDCGLTFKFLYK